MYRLVSSITVSLCLASILGCQTMGSKSEPTIQAAQKVDRLADIQTQLGIGYMAEGKFDLAWERLDQALKADSRYSTAHNAMALLYERLGQTEEARNHYQQAVAFNPRDSSARNNFGSFLCRQGMLEEAQAQFIVAVDNPLYATPEIPYTNLGLCMFQRGKKEDAQTYLRQALRLNPEIPNALIAMSDLSFTDGQELSARAYMQRYTEISNHSARTLWLGVQIERALGDLDTAASYALLLKSNYPDSRETRLLLESETEWQ
jgi:type IV pilus assembly protein PilF